MRKLDLTTPTTSEKAPEPTRKAVDGQPPVGDNQSLPKTNNTNELSPSNMKKFAKPIMIAALLAVIAGVGTGFAANRLVNSVDTGVPEGGNLQRVADDTAKEGDVFGSPDTDAFKDSAEGYLEAGGVDGEGSHRLYRPGGEAQTVYLTSSVTDLDKLVGMEVKVWGETYKGQKAGWLMDVGRVKVIKVEGESPIVK